MPLTLKSLSNRYSNSSVGFLVMIPYLMALLAMILVSRSSDRKLERRYHAAIPLTIGGFALLLLGTAASPLSSIALLSFAAMGIYSFLGPFWTMPGEFLTVYSAASGIALITSIANLGDQQLGSTSPLLPFFTLSAFILSACHCVFSGFFSGSRQIGFFDATKEPTGFMFSQQRFNELLVEVMGA